MKSVFQTPDEAEKFLNSIPKFAGQGIKASNFDLNRMIAFCDFLGNPQKKFKSIHVAGTNGKGTVCRMLASVYQSAGYNTGLYTSPHLLDVRERFLINGEKIDRNRFTDFLNCNYHTIQKNKYTYFEITTALAFWHFAHEKADIAIIETGLGGRLDATNVIRPEVSVITSIGLDHSDILGNTLESIALEKGGIIKKNIPVVTGKLPSEAKKVINAISAEKQCKLTDASMYRPESKAGYFFLYDGKKPIRIKAAERKKIDALNSAIAFAVISELQHRFEVQRGFFCEGIERVNHLFPVRGVFERLHPEKNWFFDGAHNEQAAQVLAEHMLEIAPAQNWTVVLSMMKDKLTPEIIHIWKRFPNLSIFEMNAERAASINEMKIFFPEAKEFSWQEFSKKNQNETELVIFCGSFYFYPVVSKWLGTILASEKNLSALN